MSDNRVHDEQQGVLVGEGATPRIEGNEIWANAAEGIQIDGHGSGKPKAEPEEGRGGD